MELEELTGKIIGAAIAVRRGLGPGFLESVYEEALCLELAGQGIKFRRQVCVPIQYLTSKSANIVSTCWWKNSLWWS